MLDLFIQVDKHKRVIVGPGSHGSSPSGYTMGGGHSPLSRTLGLAVDNVLEMQVPCLYVLFFFFTLSYVHFSHQHLFKQAQ